MSTGIKVKRGLDISLAGAISDQTLHTPAQVCKVDTIAVVPDDFTGVIPKLEVREGDSILAGQPLYHSKTAENLKITAPVGGKVKAVVRGERRKIERIVIDVDHSAAPLGFNVANALDNRAEARNLLLLSGMWALMRQRPFDIVPDADASFRDIFISGFDSAPLSHYPKTFASGELSKLEKGVALLRLLTDGKVYISRRNMGELPDIPGAEMVDIQGPHPASLPGTLMAAVAPVNKGERVATLSLDTLMRIGHLLVKGNVDGSTTVALVGAEVETPHLVSTLVGAPVADLVKGQLKPADHHIRLISGNVLTGIKVDGDGYLRFPYNQLTVIPEGDDVAEFMGWASLSPSKQSVSTSFPGRFLTRKLFNPDARLLGGRRAMIMSGQYDKVFPMDILPEYLIKAVIAKDIDRMEQLGIYEVAPEDFALAEYVDTSKLELQRIIREGLDYLRKELS